MAADFTGALSRVAGENVGNYAITLGSLSAGSNYTLSLSATTVNFEITPAELAVNAADKTKIYGAADPTPTYSFSGYVNGDTAGTVTVTGAASCSIAAHSENVGTYTDVITCAPGTLATGNYTFATGSLGDLEITQRTLVVTPTTARTRSTAMPIRP